MVDIRTRVEFGWPRHPDVGRTNNNEGMVAHYDGSNQGLANKAHDACIDYWQQTRRYHMRGHGWSDIGYAYGVCPHGEIFEGRGYGYYQAAQGTTAGNRDWVSCTFMSGPREEPTELQLRAWHGLRAWLMASHDVGRAIRGHRDFVSTSCPGDILYRLVRDGTLAKTPKESDDDMALPLLRKGSDSYDVKTVRALLFARGFVPEISDLRGWLERTKFDDELERIVIGFQRAKDLDADGIVGPRTTAKLLRQ